LTRDLPAPVFAADDETLLGEPGTHVNVDLRYRSFRVFGNSIDEVSRSLREHAIHVEGELAAGVTDSRFEWSYQPIDLGSGCTLVPGVTLKLVITLPNWRPPVRADRYIRNQWNEFMWDLDEHERHHAGLWIRAANRMIVAITDAPRAPSCSQAVTSAKALVARVFRRFDGLQRAFDRDVAAGRLPRPSLP
jgi:predicted secreted Zn-dependent protease